MTTGPSPPRPRAHRCSKPAHEPGALPTQPVISHALPHHRTLVSGHWAARHSLLALWFQCHPTATHMCITCVHTHTCNRAASAFAPQGLHGPWAGPEPVSALLERSRKSQERTAQRQAWCGCGLRDSWATRSRGTAEGPMPTGLGIWGISFCASGLDPGTRVCFVLFLFLLAHVCGPQGCDTFPWGVRTFT